MIFTGIAIAAVFVAIGYRIFRSADSAAVLAEVTANLPAGSRLVSTAVTADRIVVTVESAGQTEILMYDIYTLAPRGRLKLAPAR